MVLRISSGCARHVEAVHRGAPEVGVKQAAQHADGGRFPRAVGSQEAEDLALLHRQGNVIHRHEGAEGLHQVLYLYRVHAFTVPSTA